MKSSEVRHVIHKKEWVTLTLGTHVAAAMELES
jgi:hypothetical protein